MSHSGPGDCTVIMAQSYTDKLETPHTITGADSQVSPSWRCLLSLSTDLLLSLLFTLLTVTGLEFWPEPEVVGVT